MRYGHVTARQAWALFGAQLVLILLFAAEALNPSPQIERRYCTAGLDTCIIQGRSSPWHVADKACSAGQSLQFASVGVMGVRCHSIAVSGFSKPLDVCSTACGKQIPQVR